MNLQEIGQKIRAARREMNKTQAELASELGMSAGKISEIESGVIEEIGARKLMRLADAVGLEFQIKPIAHGYTLEDAEHDLSMGMR